MKRLLKQMLCFACACALLLSLAGFTVSAEDKGIAVLYTNDTHCATENFAKLAAYRAQLIKEGYTVITVDAGDAIQGEMIGSLTEGSAIVDVMNAVGYDYATLGNHEFDYTVDRILELTANEAEATYLCANFKYLPEDRDIFAPYAIEEVEGVKYAFVGIATPETYTKSTPTYFKDENGNFIYSFLENDFYGAVQNAVDAAIAEGAETVIAIGHLGIEGTTEGLRSIDVIANTCGIDVFLDGHSHELITGTHYTDKDGEEVLLSSTGSKFTSFGVLTFEDGNANTELIAPEDVDPTILSDEAREAYGKVKAVIDGYNAEFEYLFEEIGVSEAYLTENDATGDWVIRKAETNLANFVTDAYIARTGADIAFVNGGGVRTELKAGAVNRKAIMDINPWNNEMCVLEVTGSQILDALEYGMSALPDVFGSFAQVAGISFEVHSYIPSPVVTDELGDFVAVTQGAERRVKNVFVGDKPIEADKTYTLAGSCYMLQLSGYKMFADARVVAKEGLPTDTEMLLDYFTEDLECKISAERYGVISGEGRIRIIREKPEDKPATPPTGDEELTLVWLGLAMLSLLTLARVNKAKAK